ncbi:hypothetical protein [Nonomuraea typhae]|uniref:hypothetical protein n=1 Tax=Nonomuraea typhae TaxID=2603600 RepID=UPI0012F9647B|nr:hypothetical protein [Nonomuraea typhae]
MDEHAEQQEQYGEYGQHAEYVEGVTAGYVGAHEAVVGTEVDPLSINIPQVRAGATENALAEEDRRRPKGVFVPARKTRDDVLDTDPEEELAAQRARAEREDPMLAARDAMEEDLRGGS